MDEYKNEIILRCAETNGPCWECPVQEECLVWEEELNGLDFFRANKDCSKRPLTHADKFRSMNDEELAEYFPTHASLCPDLEENKMVCKGANFMANNEMCRQCWLNWLKQDAQMDVY